MRLRSKNFTPKIQPEFNLKELFRVIQGCGSLKSRPGAAAAPGRLFSDPQPCGCISSIIILASSLVFEEIATENAENYRRLTPPPRGTRANIRIYLIFPETRLSAYIFVDR